MLPDLLVYAALGLIAAFAAAWAASPRLRARIEAPKYLFVERIRRYDRGDDD